jgi:MFS family permease
MGQGDPGGQNQGGIGAARPERLSGFETSLSIGHLLHLRRRLLRPFGNQVFDEWAWRVPFLVSLLLVAIAIYIRLQLQETPIFQEIKAKGQMTRNPWKDAFLSSNFKYILIATVVLIGQGVVWYSGQFWALYFLQQVSKVDPLTSAYIVGAA